VLCWVGSSKPTFLAQRWEPRYPEGAGAPLFIYIIPYVGRGYASSLTPPPWQPRVSFSLTEARGPLLRLLLCRAGLWISFSLPLGSPESLSPCRKRRLGVLHYYRDVQLSASLWHLLLCRVVSRPASPPTGCGAPRVSSLRRLGASFLSANFVVAICPPTFFRGRLQSPPSPCQEAGLPLH
jgi:hypothetical protein